MIVLIIDDGGKSVKKRQRLSRAYPNIQIFTWRKKLAGHCVRPDKLLINLVVLSIHFRRLVGGNGFRNQCEHWWRKQYHKSVRRTEIPQNFRRTQSFSLCVQKPLRVFGRSDRPEWVQRMGSGPVLDRDVLGAARHRAVGGAHDAAAGQQFLDAMRAPAGDAGDGKERRE